MAFPYTTSVHNYLCPLGVLPAVGKSSFLRITKVVSTTGKG
jgi:hypothetical protein